MCQAFKKGLKCECSFTSSLVQFHILDISADLLLQGWVGCPPKARCCWQAAALGPKPRRPEPLPVCGWWSLATYVLPHSWEAEVGQCALAPDTVAKGSATFPAPVVACRMLAGKGVALLAWKGASVLCCFRPLGRPVEFQGFRASSSHTVNTTAWNACSLD